jgi:hypothetical protein
MRRAAYVVEAVLQRERVEVVEAQARKDLVSSAK